MKKVFLGGTCGRSNWRAIFMDKLKCDYFNPIVEDWTEECIAVENDEKDNKCNIHLYVITSETKGAYSIAEAVASSFDKSKHTILHIVPDDFSDGELRSYSAICALIHKNEQDATISDNLIDTIDLINNEL